MIIQPVTQAARLTPCQSKALDMLLRQGNVFLTGAAGTGKSYLLDSYLSGKSADEYPVVASTGAAAVIVGGRTFHSFFGLGIFEGGMQATLARALGNRRLRRRLERAQCVVVDEISMLPGTTLMAADTISRHVRGVDQPWGGLRVIAVGDFAQLPPIASSGQAKDWAFLHFCWHESDFVPALLSTVMRTQDTEFLEILNFIREGTVNEQVEKYLDFRTLGAGGDNGGTRLYPHRAQAETHNLQRLHEMPGVLYESTTQYMGQEKYFDFARRIVPIPDKLQLKTGALVMMRKNDVSGAMRWVNGSLGYLQEISEESLLIRLFEGEEIEVGKEKFTYLNGDGQEMAAAWNFPVTLAWATTIHKAQGASLDRIIVDLNRLWEPGQAYVALSRVRSGAGLTIERWSRDSIRAEQQVTAFYDLLADKARKYVPRPLFAPPVLKPEIRDRKKKKITAKDRIEMARLLLNKGEGLDQIATSLGVTPATVTKYIEKLVAQGVLLNMRRIIADIPDSARIKSAFASIGFERLTPVFEAFGGTVPFDTLRLVRLAMKAEKAKAGDEVLYNFAQ